MRRLLMYCSILLVMQSAALAFRPSLPANQVTVSFQLFYDELTPYGTWINHPDHGYVWLPMDDPDTFFPYGTRGHWVFTEYGWTWVSYYKWGWIPFHYGRWDYDPDFGWFWVPGIEWGPAWVIWRHAPGYYGWAPIRPGITITIVIGGHYHPPVPWWIFCEHRHFGRKHVYNYYVPRKHYGRIIGESRILLDSRNEKETPIHLKGPSKDLIQKETGREVDVVKIIDLQKPGEETGNGTLSIYRPKVERTTATETYPAPKRVEDIKTSRNVSPEPPPPTVDQPKHAEPTVKQAPVAKPPKVVIKPEQQEKVTRTPAPATSTPTTKAPPIQVKRQEPAVRPPQTKAEPRVTATPSTSTTTTGTAPTKKEKDEEEKGTRQPVKKN